MDVRKFLDESAEQSGPGSGSDDEDGSVHSSDDNFIASEGEEEDDNFSHAACDFMRHQESYRKDAPSEEEGGEGDENEGDEGEEEEEEEEEEEYVAEVAEEEVFVADENMDGGHDSLVDVIVWKGLHSSAPQEVYKPPPSFPNYSCGTQVPLAKFPETYPFRDASGSDAVIESKSLEFYHRTNERRKNTWIVQALEKQGMKTRLELMDDVQLEDFGGALEQSVREYLDMDDDSFCVTFGDLIRETAEEVDSMLHQGLGLPPIAVLFERALNLLYRTQKFVQCSTRSGLTDDSLRVIGLLPEADFMGWDYEASVTHERYQASIDNPEDFAGAVGLGEDSLDLLNTLTANDIRIYDQRVCRLFSTIDKFVSKYDAVIPTESGSRSVPLKMPTSAELESWGVQRNVTRPNEPSLEGYVIFMRTHVGILRTAIASIVQNVVSYSLNKHQAVCAPRMESLGVLQAHPVDTEEHKAFRKELKSLRKLRLGLPSQSNKHPVQERELYHEVRVACGLLKEEDNEKPIRGSKKPGGDKGTTGANMVERFLRTCSSSGLRRSENMVMVPVHYRAAIINSTHYSLRVPLFDMAQKQCREKQAMLELADSSAQLGDSFSNGAYEEMCSIPELLAHLHGEEQDPAAFREYASSQGTVRAVAETLRQLKTDRFSTIDVAPFRRSFQDGIIDVALHPSEPEPLGRTVITSSSSEWGEYVDDASASVNSYNTTLSGGTHYVPNDDHRSVDIPAANYRSLVSAQLESQWDQIYFYGMDGRMLYPVDGMEIAKVLIGPASCGKSTCGNVVKDFYAPEDVALLPSNIEPLFGLQCCIKSDGELKKLAICLEMTKLMRISRSDLQSAITGEDMNIAIKHQPGKKVHWTIPLYLIGNEMGPWSDASGSILRRLATFLFLVAISNVNTQLGRMLSEEMGQVILLVFNSHLAMKRDLARANKHANGSFWSGCPQYFTLVRDKICAESNMIVRRLRESDFCTGVGLVSDLGRIISQIKNSDKAGDLSGGSSAASEVHTSSINVTSALKFIGCSVDEKTGIVKGIAARSDCERLVRECAMAYIGPPSNLGKLSLDPENASSADYDLDALVEAYPSLDGRTLGFAIAALRDTHAGVFSRDEEKHVDQEGFDAASHFADLELADLAVPAEGVDKFYASVRCWHPTANNSTSMADKGRNSETARVFTPLASTTLENYEPPKYPALDYQDLTGNSLAEEYLHVHRLEAGGSATMGRISGGDLEDFNDGAFEARMSKLSEKLQRESLYKVRTGVERRACTSEMRKAARGQAQRDRAILARTDNYLAMR